MKRSLFLLLITCLLTVIFCCFHTAEAATYGDLTYEVSNGEVTITACNQSATSVYIPATIDGYPVAKLKHGAFYLCIRLEEINVSSDNEYLSSENGILFNKDKTILLIYPANNPLGTYLIPEGVISIGDLAFACSEWLETVIVRNDVCNIGLGAFRDCRRLRSVFIGGNVSEIKNYAFDGCRNLRSINVESLNQHFIVADNVLFDKNMTTLIQYPCGRTDKTYTIPQGVVHIALSAFGYCEELTEIFLPNSVKNIPDNAFRFCYSLQSVQMCEGVINIGDCAFLNCTSLASIVIPKSVTSIGEDAFYNTRTTIYVHRSSYSRRYAEANSIPFVILDMTDYLPGDVTGDGELNRKDLLRLAKFFAGWDVELDEAAADVTGDGAVNRQDLLRLAKYFAGWDVTLGA